MKVLIVASCFLAVLTVVDSRRAWEDFFDTIQSLDGGRRGEKADKHDIDLGNGNFIKIHSSFNDPSEPIEEEKTEIEKKKEEKFKKVMREQEYLYASADGDYIDHDCQNIRPLTEENWNKEPWNNGPVKRPMIKPKKAQLKRKPDRIYTKYNSAYGIPMIGTDKFSDEAMLRGCYLLRYIFADNQHLRIHARREGFHNVGFDGGVCCPPQMNTYQLSCPCDSPFPKLGKGAPAHEMAHEYIPYLKRLVADGRMKLPEYVDKYNPEGENVWEFKDKPYAVPWRKCNFRPFKENDGRYNDSFYIFTWNSMQQDRERTPPTTKIGCKIHHYMIYSGQEKWLFQGNKYVKEKARSCLWKRSPNLYGIMKMIWPCDNNYVPVCKDAAYGFKLGASKVFKIGKAEDPNDISKMTCRENLDKAEVKEKPEIIEYPTEDIAKDTKCVTVARSIDEVLAPMAKRGSWKKMAVNAWAKYLKTDEEHSWWLRRCCANKMKFDNDVPPPEYEEGEEVVGRIYACGDEDDVEEAQDGDYE